MKFKNTLIMALALCLSMMTVMQANAAGPAYPINNPSYIPTAVAAPQAFTAPGDYTYKVSGISTVSVRVTGTCTSLAATLQGSNNGTTWTDLPLARVDNNAPAAAIGAAGFWRASTAGFSDARLHITALAATCTVAMAGTATANTPQVSGDPCLNPALVKTTAAVNQGASVTTKVVDTTGATAIYACSFLATVGGTNPVVTFKSGTRTSADCDTATATLSGAMVPSATIGVLALGGGTILSTAASHQLCLTTGAATSVQGILTYVRQ